MSFNYYEIDQSSDEWHKIRLGKITASRFKDALAMGVKGNWLKTRADYKAELVAERIIGFIGKKDVYVTPAMQWGNMNEEIARTTYQLRTGNKVSKAGIAVWVDDETGKELPIAASSDGFITRKGESKATGNLEIKSLEPHNHLYKVIKGFERTQTMPDDYKHQVQGQMMIQELDWTHFVGSDSRMPAGLDLMACHVDRDEDFIEWLKFELLAFAKEVDAEFYHFLKYLPVCERTCRICGLVFTDKLAICPECKMNSTVVNQLLEPAELRLSELKDLPGALHEALK